MDDLIKNIIEKEEDRQKHVLNLIASENYVSDSILKLQGSMLTNKYAEGYPKKRYYGGCVYIDEIENIAIDYACKLFNCKYANVQPHSGSSANMAVYRSLLKPKEKVLGMNLTDGGHLTHGFKVNFSGVDYEFISYKLNDETEILDYEEIKKLALINKPKLIVAGSSAYTRKIDFKKFKEIADLCGAYLMADIAHISGLVATDLHTSPFPYADVVTSTTHKTLRGPRGGIILTNNKEIFDNINKSVFPGIQGGPLMHVIAAKAQAFYEALNPKFKEYQVQVLKNIKTIERVFKKNNYKLISNGTDNHMLVVDIYKSVGISGKKAEEILESINIIVNKNTIHNEILPFKETSGIRIGSPALTTLGFKEKEFETLAFIIIRALNNYEDSKILSELKKEVYSLIQEIKYDNRW